MEFAKTRKRLTLEFVIAHVVRKGFGGGKYIYDNHYKKHELVSRFSQADMALYLGTRQGHVSERLSELQKMKLLRKIERQAYNTMLLYYKVGTWKGTPGKDNYQETLYFNMVFDPLARIAKEDRMRDKQYMSPDNIRAEIDNLEPDDAWYEDDLLHWDSKLEEAVSREGIPGIPSEDVGYPMKGYI
jgi:hypothetical protein